MSIHSPPYREGLGMSPLFHLPLYPVEAAGLDFLRQFRTGGLDDASLLEDVYDIGLDVVEQTVVVGDD